MKIAVIGAGGTRGPLLVDEMLKRSHELGLTDVALMDLNLERLRLLAPITAEAEGARDAPRIVRTSDPREALRGADFVIMTIRVGGAEARIVDERVALELGVLGQETTGPGGFAMAMRTIPVVLEYLDLMREVCTDAWLVNFTNPSGLVAQAAIGPGGWARTAGICDAPAQINRAAAALLGAAPGEIELDYFGLNHLGWVREVRYGGTDHLPRLLAAVAAAGPQPGLPFDGRLLRELGLFPNEYLYYYYHSREALERIQAAEFTRGEQVAAMNATLFSELRRLNEQGRTSEMVAAYRAYTGRRSDSYMAAETGPAAAGGALGRAIAALSEENGYATVALDVIASLAGAGPRRMILNVPNRTPDGEPVAGMPPGSVVEIPCRVDAGRITPMTVGTIPANCLGLMLEVKAYEENTIRSATEGSRSAALLALAQHPLVRDFGLAERLLDGYCDRHAPWFPTLK